MRAVFDPYGAWRGLAAAHALRAPAPPLGMAAQAALSYGYDLVTMRRGA